MICLDSSFIIDLLRSKENAIQLFNNIKSEGIFTTIINIYELMSGIYQLKGARHEHRIKILENFVNQMMVLNLDKFSVNEASKINGELSIGGDIIEDLDILIAGICLTNGCNKIITRNVKHFERIPGLKVESY